MAWRVVALCLVLGSCPKESFASDPLDVWVRRDSITRQTLQSVTFGGSQFVAVGAGVTCVSSNGMNWKVAAPATERSVIRIRHIGERFVLLESPAGIRVSVDGQSWVSADPGVTNQLSDVAWGNGRFVVVGADGVILSSPDALTWKPSPRNDRPHLLGVVFAKGRFLATGSPGTLLTSVDGENWVAAGTAANPSLGRLAFGDDTFMALGLPPRFEPMVSKDGIEWTVRDGPDNRGKEDITFGAGGFLIPRNSFIPELPNYLLFYASSNPSLTLREWPDNGNLWSAAYGADRFVVVGESGTILSAGPDLQWTVHNPRPSLYATHLLFDQGLFLASGQGQILTSTDGSVWTARQPIPGAARFAAVCRGPDQYLAMDEEGRVAVSTHGVHWTAISRASVAGPITGLAYGRGLYVATGYSRTLLTSTNGTVWTPRDPGFLGNIEDVLWADNRFVIVGLGNISTSEDGLIWTRRASVTTANLKSITYGGGLFLAVGYGGTMVTSTNGAKWTARSSGSFPDLMQAAYGSGHFLAVGAGGALLTSTNGITWTPRTTGAADALTAVAYGNGRFVIAGSDSLLQSGELESPPAPHLEALEPISGGGWRLTLTHLVGSEGEIETSNDLQTWQPLVPFQVTHPSMQILDQPSSGSAVPRYYRATVHRL